MSYARPSDSSTWQTTAPRQGSGCLSGFILPPVSILLFGLILFLFSSALNFPVQAGSPLLQVTAPAASSTGIAPFFTPEIQYWEKSILRWANMVEIDPNLVAVVMQIESCGNPRALSRAGAMGLFQVMPYHFLTSENPYDPDINAQRGLSYLKRSLAASTGNPGLALAGYNGGIGVVKHRESTWTDETTRYVYYGSDIYADARKGSIYSPRLEEWYKSYGAGLCEQAADHLGLP